jgi:hypothetical protein
VAVLTVGAASHQVTTLPAPLRSSVPREPLEGSTSSRCHRCPTPRRLVEGAAAALLQRWQHSQSSTPQHREQEQAPQVQSQEQRSSTQRERVQRRVRRWQP